MTQVRITKIKNFFIIKKTDDSDFYILRNGAIIMPTFNFSALLKYMVFKGLVSPKVLEGVLDEYYNSTD